MSIFQLLGSLALTGGLALLLLLNYHYFFRIRINQILFSSFASAISVLIFMDAAALWNQLAFD